MQHKYPGLYLYYDWLDALQKMEPEKAMRIITNLRNFSEKDEEPTPMGGAEDMIQSFMLAQLRRSKKSSETNKRTYRQKQTVYPKMISELIPREELDREATPEELRLFGRFFERTANQDTEISSCQSREKSPEQEAKEKARKILEAINNTYGGQSNA
jgi:hypothetical protein